MMFHTRPGLPDSSARTQVAALSMAGLAIAYSLLSVFYFYEDFFKYLGGNSLMTTERTGWHVLVDAWAADGYYHYLWTILSPWRIVGAALAVALLGVSAVSLWHSRPRARTLSLITLWGVLFPQVLWYTEFLVDWHQGQGLAEAVMLAFAVCALPTWLLARPGRPLADWNCAHPSRLLGFAIVCGWIGFAATEFMDHSYQLESWTAYIGALAAVVLAALATRGIYGLRSWGLLCGIGSAVALAVIPLSVSWTSYVPSGGYIDGFQSATTATDVHIALSMLIPATVLWILSAPFMHAFCRKLRTTR
ncbi:MAG: hypothetical protein MJE77_29145 [Proteobacteria bacterium]|nr:hypothetical protein [Pseudomonadota bacterium]